MVRGHPVTDLHQGASWGATFDVTRIPDAELANELGGRARDADTVAYVERRLHGAGFIAKQRGGQPHLHGRRAVAVWQLRPRLR